MTFPIAAGEKDYSSSGTSKFSPKLWSAKTVLKLYDATVLTEISNTDYEGEIKDMGDTVVITTVPDITINTYYKGKKLTNESPESAPVELVIDKGFDYAFKLNDLDKLQSKPNLMEQWTTNAAENMKIKIDTNVLANIYTDVASTNKGATAGRKSASFNLGTSGSAVQLTKANVLEYIIDCESVLDEANVPESGRWMVIPAWMSNLIQKSDLKDASLSGDGTSIMRNGRLGMIGNFTLYRSNNVATASDTGTKYHVPFGHKMGFTFATQLVKNRVIELQDDFAHAAQGLNVYGFKVVIPAALGELYCYK